LTLVGRQLPKRAGEHCWPVKQENSLLGAGVETVSRLVHGVLRLLTVPLSTRNAS